MLDVQMLEDPVGRWALLAMIAAATWKIWLRLKADTRADKSEVHTQRAHGVVVAEYDKVVETLREEVARLAQSVERLSRELEEERVARYDAERIARELRDRVDYPERKLRDGDDL
ncbi:MAG: hypothetical protein IT364_16670 [Candidatus Hydrogenedentes bacterium]|nr:hypothetical protein [Candidatus Hydrogenedentota bacterium]